ncbi:hypothetical protein Tco_0542657 [Tanacetum coccineum]
MRVGGAWKDGNDTLGMNDYGVGTGLGVGARVVFEELLRGPCDTLTYARTNGERDSCAVDYWVWVENVVESGLSLLRMNEKFPRSLMKKRSDCCLLLTLEVISWGGELRDRVHDLCSRMIHGRNVRYAKRRKSDEQRVARWDEGTSETPNGRDVARGYA